MATRQYLFVSVEKTPTSLLPSNWTRTAISSRLPIIGESTNGRADEKELLIICHVLSSKFSVL